MSVRSPELVAEEEVHMSVKSMAGMSSSSSTSFVPGGFRPAIERSPGAVTANLGMSISRIAVHPGGQHPETDSTQSGQSTGAPSGADKDGDNDGR